MTSDLPTQDQRRAVGAAARNVLRFALSQERPDKYLFSMAVPAVCRTFDCNPDASAAAIRELVRPERLRTHGFAGLHWLAGEVKGLARFDPLLVEEIYRSAFATLDESEDKTPMGGTLLPLVSTRKQDYDHGLYQLAEAYRSFVETAPFCATRAVADVMQRYVDREHPPTPPIAETAFGVRGRQASLRADFSHIWDRGGAHGDQHEGRMLDAWQSVLSDLALADGQQDLIGEIVDVVAEATRPAVLWRRLLLLGAQHPTTIGSALKDLAHSTSAFAAPDLQDAAGEFLASVFPTQGEADKRRIEQAILSLPAALGPEAGERARNVLLSALTVDLLVTEEARRIASTFRDGDWRRPRGPHVRAVWAPPDREEEILRDRGVPVDEPQNRRLQQLAETLRAAAEKCRGKGGVAVDVSPALELVSALQDALRSAAPDGVHPEQARRASELLVHACVTIATCGEGPAFEEAIPLVRNILLLAVEGEECSASDTADLGFDETPVCSETPRVSAARGLMCLARHGVDETLRSTIERLSRDASKEVRLQVACESRVLLRTAPDLFWLVTQRLAAEEPRPGVLWGLLGSLQLVARADPDRIARLAQVVYERLKDDPSAKEARELCVDIFVGLSVWWGQPDCGAFLRNLAANPLSDLEAVAHLPFRLREPIVHGATNPIDSRGEAVRHRACEIFSTLTRAAVAAWQELLNRRATPASGDERLAAGLAHVLGSLAAELYFASGSFKEGKAASEEQPLPENVRRRFYKELGPALDELAQVGLPGIAHRLVETLEDMVTFDPVGVFRRIAAVVTAAEMYGYTQEALAAERIVALVRRYLADYRPLLQENPASRQALMDVLNAFVHWPEASQLVFHLEDIWR